MNLFTRVGIPVLLGLAAAFLVTSQIDKPLALVPKNVAETVTPFGDDFLVPHITESPELAPDVTALAELALTATSEAEKLRREAEELRQQLTAKNSDSGPEAESLAQEQDDPESIDAELEEPKAILVSLVPSSVDPMPLPQTVSIPFSFDSSDLSKQQAKKLGEVARNLKENSDWEVQLRGFTDRSGRTHYNEKLAKERCRAIRAKLIALGADDTQIDFVSFGESQATGPDKKSPDDRRVEIRFREKPAQHLRATFSAQLRF